MEHVESTEVPLIQIVKAQHHTNLTLLRTVKTSKKSFQSETKQIKEHNGSEHKMKWEERRMHGKFPRSLDQKLVDKEQSYRSLNSGDVKRKTESTRIAAQDQELSANHFKKQNLEEESESKCLTEYEGTTDHLTSGFSILAKNEQIMRHDKFCTYLHYSICKELGI
jgi:hypothetical protein